MNDPTQTPDNFPIVFHFNTPGWTSTRETWHDDVRVHVRNATTQHNFKGTHPPLLFMLIPRVALLSHCGPLALTVPGNDRDEVTVLIAPVTLIETATHDEIVTRARGVAERLHAVATAWLIATAPGSVEPLPVNSHCDHVETLLCETSAHVLAFEAAVSIGSHAPLDRLLTHLGLTAANPPTMAPWAGLLVVDPRLPRFLPDAVTPAVTPETDAVTPGIPVGGWFGGRVGGAA